MRLLARVVFAVRERSRMVFEPESRQRSFAGGDRTANLNNQGPSVSSPEPAPYLSQSIIQQYRVNQRIRAREVRVIVASSGEQLGIMKIQDALRAAAQAGLDLVEVAATANPPVCRIVDFGKFKYEISKHDKDKKNATSKLKEIKFRVNISSNDYETKLRHGEEFLDKSNKVRVQLQFRGRENAHKELGVVLMKRIAEDLSLMANVEQAPRLMGKAVTMTLAPLPVGKRKRRFDKSLPLPEDPGLDKDEDDEEDEDDVKE